MIKIKTRDRRQWQPAQIPVENRVQAIQSAQHRLLPEGVRTEGAGRRGSSLACLHSHPSRTVLYTALRQGSRRGGVETKKRREKGSEHSIDKLHFPSIPSASPENCASNMKEPLYYVMNRGDQKEPILKNDKDRILFLNTLREASTKTDWHLHAWCLMESFPFGDRDSQGQPGFRHALGWGGTEEARLESSRSEKPSQRR
jgi:hypothetical protein